jgi:tyrosine-protein phosphatase SIW14
MKSRILFPTSLLILLLATVMQVGARPQTDNAAPPSSHAPGKRLTAKGIPNFGQVTSNLYRGGQPNADGLQELKNRGVDLVVDLRGGSNKSEKADAEKLGMGYVSIPSHCPFPSDAPWAHFLKVMRENRGKKVFVHCRLGDDRTGLAIATYRISEENWSAAEALNEMKVFGFSSVHHAICPGLEGYVEHFPERLKNSPAFRDLQK